MSFVVIIPARYASTRLPGKPLVDINGKPMIVHVLERARESGADRVIVATDHPDVARAVEAAGGEVCMTRADHQSGTERLAEVVEKCGFSDDTVIVNVQGDGDFMMSANEMATAAQYGLGVVVVVVDNGTFVNNGEFGLTIGMGRDGLLSDRAKRRKHGLPPELRMATPTPPIERIGRVPGVFCSPMPYIV